MVHLMSRPLCFALLALALGSCTVNGAILPPHHLSERQSTEGGYGGTDRSAFCQKVVVSNKGPAYLHTQVTQTNNCGQAICTAGKVDEHTFGIEASVDVSVEDGGLGGGLGVGVVDEWTSGETEECQGAPGQTVCQWLKTAYTVFELGYEDDAYGSNGAATCGSNFEAKFPNENNAGGEYYCVVGERYCRSVNSAYWE